jgi:hypothetical protein
VADEPSLHTFFLVHQRFVGFKTESALKPLEEEKGKYDKLPAFNKKRKKIRRQRQKKHSIMNGREIIEKCWNRRKDSWIGRSSMFEDAKKNVERNVQEEE